MLNFALYFNFTIFYRGICISGFRSQGVKTRNPPSTIEGFPFKFLDRGGKAQATYRRLT